MWGECNIEKRKLVAQTKEKTWDWSTNKQTEKDCPSTKTSIWAPSENYPDMPTKNLQSLKDGYCQGRKSLDPVNCSPGPFFAE